MAKLFDPSYILQVFPILIAQLPTTLLVTAVALVFGLILGTLTAVFQVRRVPLLFQIGKIYISFIRGTPMIVQLFLFFFLLPALFRLLGMANVQSIPLILYAFVACSLHLGGYFAETLRGSLISVGTDQLEAAYTVGMSTFKAYERILLPQAFALALPDTASLVINTLKNTSLLFNIGLVDIMTRAKLLAGYTQRGLEIYIAVGILYILLCLVIHLVFTQLELGIRVKKYGR